MTEQTKLTKADIEAISAQYAAEMALLPQPPTLDAQRAAAGLVEPSIAGLRAEGFADDSVLTRALDVIGGTGRVITLLIAEIIQSGAALIIGVVFAVLEYWRVYHGAGALGQSDTQSALIAFAVVTANVVHPIYSLRQLRGQTELEIVRMTGRGYLTAWWRRLTGRPIVEQVDLYYNPTLHFAAAVITWSTVVLAVYDILSPLLTQIFTGQITRPIPIMLMELVMGLGLSVSGVFFLQSAAHEIGVRTLTDQPRRIADLLAARRAQYADQQQQIATLHADQQQQHDAQSRELYERIKADYMAAKLADEQRKEAKRQPQPIPFGSSARTPGDGESTLMTLSANGHGTTANGNGKH